MHDGEFCQGIVATSPGSLGLHTFFSACNIEKLREPGDEAKGIVCITLMESM